MKWFLHGKGLGLGNFINCTPFLQALSDKWGEKINVYFDGGITKECYYDAPFLNILKVRPLHAPFAHTRLYIMQKERGYLMSDCEYFSTVISNHFGVDGTKYHTYIDNPQIKAIGYKDYYCVVNGAGAWKKDYLDKKIIPDKEYKAIANFLQKDALCLGSEHCRKPLEFGIDVRHWSIRAQLSVLARCDFLVTNEGGLAHAAGCYKIPTFIMWKDTDRIKNKNPNPNCFYSYENHFENFKEFYKLYC